jgi:hypothetical protein
LPSDLPLLSAAEDYACRWSSGAHPVHSNEAIDLTLPAHVDHLLRPACCVVWAALIGTVSSLLQRIADCRAAVDPMADILSVQEATEELAETMKASTGMAGSGLNLAGMHSIHYALGICKSL